MKRLASRRFSGGPGALPDEVLVQLQGGGSAQLQQAPDDVHSMLDYPMDDCRPRIQR